MTTLARSLSKVKTFSLPEINWSRFYIIIISCLICFSAVLLVWYVVGINQLTKGSYLIQNYDKKINVLSVENRNLEMNFAESGFLGGLQEKVKELSFQKTTQVKYIQMLDNSFALNPK